MERKCECVLSLGSSSVTPHWVTVHLNARKEKGWVQDTLVSWGAPVSVPSHTECVQLWSRRCLSSGTSARPLVSNKILCIQAVLTAFRFERNANQRQPLKLKSPSQSPQADLWERSSCTPIENLIYLKHGLCAHRFILYLTSHASPFPKPPSFPVSHKPWTQSDGLSIWGRASEVHQLVAHHVGFVANGGQVQRGVTRVKPSTVP